MQSLTTVGKVRKSLSILFPFSLCFSCVLAHPAKRASGQTSLILSHNIFTTAKQEIVFLNRYGGGGWFFINGDDKVSHWLSPSQASLSSIFPPVCPRECTKTMSS